jgi:hypothetical protein
MTPVTSLDRRGSMRGATQGNGSRYLSMALASRKLMIRLDSFAQTGEVTDPMVEALRNLLTIMDTGWETSNSFAPIPGRSPFGRYEQALVVNEVAEPFNSRDVRGKLGRIADGTIQGADRGEIVREINEFLYDLENRALYKYSEESSERAW